jgi:superfamily I DNA and/or RNA helicase
MLTDGIEEVDLDRPECMRGAEVDVVILWCTTSKEMDVARDSMRLSVALTRARKHLILIGRCNRLSKNLLWSRLIKEAKKAARVIPSNTME